MSRDNDLQSYTALGETSQPMHPHDIETTAQQIVDRSGLTCPASAGAIVHAEGRAEGLGGWSVVPYGCGGHVLRHPHLDVYFSDEDPLEQQMDIALAFARAKLGWPGWLEPARAQVVEHLARAILTPRREFVADLARYDMQGLIGRYIWVPERVLRMRQRELKQWLRPMHAV